MPIDDVLIQAGIVDGQALARAKEIQKRDGVSLARAIGSLGGSTEEEVAEAIARGVGVEYIPHAQLILPEDCFEILSVDFCRKALVLPLGWGSRGLRLVMANPL